MKNRDNELISRLNNRKKHHDLIDEEQEICYGECYDCGCDCEFNETVKNIPINFLNKKELIKKLNQKTIDDGIKEIHQNENRFYNKGIINTKSMNDLSKAIENSKKVDKRVKELFEKSDKKEYYTTDEVVERIVREMEKFFTEKENKKKEDNEIFNQEVLNRHKIDENKDAVLKEILYLLREINEKLSFIKYFK